MHLREFLLNEYEKQGWVVCSDFFQAGTCLPEGWIGSYPDLIAIKGNRKLAVCIESRSGFVGDYLPKKWKSILKNPGFSLLVVARERQAYDLTMQTAKLHGIELECRTMKKEVHRHRHVRDNLFKKRIRLFALVTGLVMTFIIAFMAMPNARKTFQKHLNVQLFRSYRPNDFERQMESLRKEMQKMYKK